MRTKLLSLGLAFVFLLSAAGGMEAQADSQVDFNLEDYDYVEDQLLVSFKPSVGKARSNEVLAELGMERVRRVEEINLDVLRLPPGLTVEKALEIFSKRPEVKYVEPNFILSIAENLQVESVYQWGLEKIQAQAAWNLIPQQNRTPILIAVVDTGIDPTTPELVGKLWSNSDEIAGDGVDNDNNGKIDDTWGWDFANGDNNPLDDQMHGSAVSSVIASKDDGQGITGVCPWCQVMAVKVMTAEGTGSLDVVASGITYAVNNGAKVINLSLAGAAPYGLEIFMQSLKDAVNYAWNSGALVVAAAGNSGTNSKMYPAGFDRALAVGSTDSADSYSCFSNYAEGYISVAAPGSAVPIVDIRTVNDSIVYASGTSLAAPHVAGLAGLLLSQDSTRTNQQLWDLIKTTTVDLGPDGPDAFFGSGRIDALRAVQEDTSDTTSPHEGYVLTSDATAYAHARKLARSSDGTLHLVWHDKEGDQYTIKYASSIDDGVSWSSSETIFSSTAETYHPAIAVDNENIFVVFPTKFGAQYYQIAFMTKPISNGTWSDEEMLMGGTYNAVRPDIYLDPSNNHLHVVGSSFDDTQYVYYRNSSDGGATWAPVVNVNFEWKTRYASVYAYGDRVYIASRLTDGNFLIPSFKLSVMRSLNGGLSFQDRQGFDTVTSLESSEYGISLAGYQDTFYILSEWKGQIQFRISNSGVTWDGVYVYAGGGKWPSITAGPDNQVYLAWVGSDGKINRWDFQGDNLHDGSNYTVKPVLGTGNYPNFKEGTNHGRAELVSTVCSGAPFGISYNSTNGAGNTPPYAFFNSPASGSAGTPVTFDASSAYDPDGDLLTYSWNFGDNTPIANGKTASHTYLTSGTFTVTLTINDGNGGTDSTSATINIVGAPSNDPPIAVNDSSYTTNEDTLLSVAAPGVLLNDSDPNGDPLTASLVTGPSNGTLTFNPDGSFTYTPASNFNGSDSFTYIANDGKVDSNPATVTIAVNAVNDPPIAANDSYTTAEDTTLDVPAPGVLGNDTDVDGISLSAALLSGTTHGSLTLYASGQFIYNPIPDYTGPDSFTYSISDGNGGTDTAIVTITVNPVNDPPVAADDSATTDEDSAVIINVRANDSDVDGDALVIFSVTQPGHGTAVNNGTDITYTPDANYNGPDSFAYTISDGNGGTDTAIVTITVNPVNDPPVAADDSATTDEDSAVIIDVRANDSDVDGDALVIFSFTQPSHGTAVNNGTDVTYTPDANYNGPDSFAYTISDGNGGTDTATVTITVNPVNDPPVADINGPSSGETGQSLSFSASGSSDQDGDLLTYSWDFGDANSDSGMDVSHTYLASGTFTVSLTVEDGNGGSDTTSVQVDIIEPPAFVDFTAQSEIPGGGTVSGSYTDTYENDEVVQSITERQSGGKPSSRYSYLEHKWVFNVTSGNVMTFYANTRINSTNNEDSFTFEFSTNDDTYNPMFTVDARCTPDNPEVDQECQYVYILPAETQGTVYIRVTDTDHTPGALDLDTIIVDHLYIRVETQSGPPPASPPSAPSGLVASAVSSSEIHLTWTDNSDNESGFYIERWDGSGWTPIASVGANETTYLDTGLATETPYDYRVQAHNAAGSSDYSNTASATTFAGSTTYSMHVGELVGSGIPVRSKWEATVTITVHDEYHGALEGVLVTGTWSYGGEATCTTNAVGKCSVINNNLKVSSLNFEVTNLTLNGYIYLPEDNHDPVRNEDGKTFITIFAP